ncbi:MAG: methyltransferase domain-containing protein [Phycisphaerae bacterium]
MVGSTESVETVTSVPRLCAWEPSAGVAPHWLACPQCESTLNIDDRASRCKRCAREWPHRDRIPCFTEGDYYWGQISREQMRGVLKLIETDGWDSAVALLRSKYPNEYNLVFDPSRAAWLFLADPPASELALDVGAGYGGIARWMGSFFREVVALEANVERTAFASHLYRATGATNVRPILGNMHRSPMRKGVFDLVAMTGVLEWATMFGDTIDAMTAQRELLERCSDLLKPGGQLYVAIENRFAPLFLLGARDHDRFPWAGVLPYRASRWLVRRFQGMERQSLTHGRARLVSLIRRAGFADVDVHLPLPGYHRPMVIAEGDDRTGPPWLMSRIAVPSAVSDIGRTAVVCWRLLCRFPALWSLMAPVVPAFAILARKKVG